MTQRKQTILLLTTTTNHNREGDSVQSSETHERRSRRGCTLHPIIKKKTFSRASDRKKTMGISYSTELESTDDDVAASVLFNVVKGSIDGFTSNMDATDKNSQIMLLWKFLRHDLVEPFAFKSRDPVGERQPDDARALQIYKSIRGAAEGATMHMCSDEEDFLTLFVLPKLAVRLCEEYPVLQTDIRYPWTRSLNDDDRIGLENIEKKLQQRILRYLGCPTDLLSCARSCRSLQHAVTDDSVWSTAARQADRKKKLRVGVSGKAFKNLSCRERACINMAETIAVRCHKKYNIRGESGILEVLGGAHRWKALVVSFFQLPHRCGNIDLPAIHDRHAGGHHRFRLRGDTLAVLLKIVEDSNVLLFRQAVELASSAGPAAAYPELREDHLRKAAGVGTWFGDDETAHAVAGAAILRFKISRRLAYQGGAVKMGNCVYDRVWCHFVSTMDQILHRASECAILESNCSHHSDETGVRHLLPGQHIRDFAPCKTVMGTCEACNTDIVEHTLVPRQIELGAKALGLPLWKVYGDDWLATVSTEVEERRAAMSRYDFVMDLDADVDESDLDDFEGEWSLRLEDDEDDDSMSTTLGDILDDDDS